MTRAVAYDDREDPDEADHYRDEWATSPMLPQHLRMLTYSVHFDL